jgi:hypothetical protein
MEWAERLRDGRTPPGRAPPPARSGPRADHEDRAPAPGAASPIGEDDRAGTAPGSDHGSGDFMITAKPCLRP